MKTPHYWQIFPKDIEYYRIEYLLKNLMIAI